MKRFWNSREFRMAVHAGDKDAIAAMHARSEALERESLKFQMVAHAGDSVADSLAKKVLRLRDRELELDARERAIQAAERIARAPAAPTAPFADSRMQLDLYRDARRFVGPHIYLLRVCADGPQKLGWSKDLRRRLQKIQVTNPYALQLIDAVPGTIEEEESLHRSLVRFSIRGEWYLPDAPIAECLAAHVSERAA